MAKIVLYTEDRGTVKLDEAKEISRGGEGVIIEYNKNFVSKLYLPGIPPITKTKFNELKILDKSEFIKPEKLLYYDRTIKKIIGFLMKMVPSHFFPLYSAFNKNFCKRNALDEKWKLKVSKIILDRVQYAHNKKVVIGDLSGFNILVDEIGSVAFIDVDSYETPNAKHSGRLLDDIRDYYCNGIITEESDFFASAVIVFNLLTSLHPFKGIHSTYKGLADRMIHRIPVFESSKQLVLPKCYTPIVDTSLQEQFKQIFKDGKRFLIDVDTTKQTVIKKVTRTIQTASTQLMMNTIIESDSIKYVKCSNRLCCIVEKDSITVYETSHWNYHKLLYIVTESPKDVMAVGDKMFIFDNNKLYRFDRNGTKHEITNVNFKNVFFHKQYDNMYLIVDDEHRYILDLNRVINNEVYSEYISTYGRGFSCIEGVTQNIGGSSYIYYTVSDKLNIVKFPYPIKDLIQHKNVGIAQYVKDDKVNYSMFNINGLNVNMYDTGINSLKHFTADLNKKIVVMPEDNQISFLRIDDFLGIKKFACSDSDAQSEVFFTDSGIILNNYEKVILLNLRK